MHTDRCEPTSRPTPLPSAWLELARILRQIAATHADELRARREQAKREAA